MTLHSGNTSKINNFAYQRCSKRSSSSFESHPLQKITQLMVFSIFRLLYPISPLAAPRSFCKLNFPNPSRSIPLEPHTYYRPFGTHESNYDSGGVFYFRTPPPPPPRSSQRLRYNRYPSTWGPLDASPPLPIDFH